MADLEETLHPFVDSGDIPAKLDHLLHHLGRPTLIVESGGRTPEGATKLHVWWKLTEPAEGADLDRFVGRARPVLDADAVASPEPPAGVFSR